jgi:hypothetical protein
MPCLTDGRNRSGDDTVHIREEGNINKQFEGENGGIRRFAAGILIGSLPL